MSDTPLLRLDEVSRIYGEEVKVHALDGVSLDIKVCLLYTSDAADE